MRIDMLNNILNELNSSSADVEASAIISTDGLIMASQFLILMRTESEP